MDEEKNSEPQESQEPQENTNSQEQPMAAGEKFEFAAEIQKLLDILVHSLYTHKEIFLRELVSNAADALDKVRFKNLTSSDIRDEKLALEITIAADKDHNLLTIHDTGIGMTREEIIENIGTIAHSGSLSFLQKIADVPDSQSKINLIGQFGVGFYSVFMVANRVDILTLSADPQARAWLWSSDGSGKYTIAEAEKPQRGTEIKIHLKDDAKDYLEQFRIESIIQRYSDFVSYPIKLGDKQINKLSAIWQRPASEVKDEEYHEFYKYLTHIQEKPLSHLHLSFDAPIQFSSILFIPASVPWDMMFEIPEKWHGVHLYAKRVFIQSDCEQLLPQYLRFVRGVVDSDDLPLNISRESLQENQLLGKIRNNLVRKVLDHLDEMSVERDDDYRKLWGDFGKFLKQGYRIDFENREKLARLFRFNSSECKDKDELVSLKQYVERMPAAQKDIYYHSGENRNAIEKSPHMELFKRKGIEVLYLTEPVDDFLFSDLREFDDKKFVAIDKEDVAIDEVVTAREQQADAEPKAESDTSRPATEVSDRQMEDLLAYLKDTLKEKVSDVRLSKRLVGSPCCLVAGKDAPDIGMQKLMKMMNESYEMPKRILEINPKHSLVRSMAKIYADSPRESLLANFAHQLVDNALLLEGTQLDIRDMVPRIHELMERMAQSITVQPEAASE